MKLLPQYAQSLHPKDVKSYLEYLNLIANSPSGIEFKSWFQNDKQIEGVKAGDYPGILSIKIKKYAKPILEMHEQYHSELNLMQEWATKYMQKGMPDSQHLKIYGRPEGPY